jgi:phage gp36-like protein
MYCTLSDIKKVLPEKALVSLTDDEGLGQINASRVDEAISQADGEIDAYIGSRYSVPLSSVPAVIRRCSCDITIYILYKRYEEDIPETREMSYKDAIRVLTRIADGKMELPVTVTSDGDFATGVLTTSHFEEDNA